jgi:hypothetical protein
MKPIDLALRYMEIFFSGKDLERLKDILAEDLSFTGPLYTFNSAKDYINSLKEDPPCGMKYEIIKSFEDESGANLIYNFHKENISTTMTQLFEVKDDKISKINLVFDIKAFTKMQ